MGGGDVLIEGAGEGEGSRKKEVERGGPHCGLHSTVRYFTVSAVY